MYIIEMTIDETYICNKVSNHIQTLDDKAAKNATHIYFVFTEDKSDRHTMYRLQEYLIENKGNYPNYHFWDVSTCTSYFCAIRRDQTSPKWFRQL